LTQEALEDAKSGVGERAVSATLTDADHAAIAEKVIEGLRPWLDTTVSSPTNYQLVDAATVSEALGVGIHYVYAHQTELGAQRIGSGPKPRLRFDLAEARAAFREREHSHSATAERPKPAGRKRRQSSEVPLQPVGRD
jgi:hypothetical protein